MSLHTIRGIWSSLNKLYKPFRTPLVKYLFLDKSDSSFSVHHHSTHFHRPSLSFDLKDASVLASVSLTHFFLTLAVWGTLVHDFYFPNLCLIISSLSLLLLRPPIGTSPIFGVCSNSSRCIKHPGSRFTFAPHRKNFFSFFTVISIIYVSKSEILLNIEYFILIPY